MKPYDWTHLKCVCFSFVLPGVEESYINSNHSSSSSQKSILWIKLLNSVAADGIFFFSPKTASNTAHR